MAICSQARKQIFLAFCTGYDRNLDLEEMSKRVESLANLPERCGVRIPRGLRLAARARKRRASEPQHPPPLPQVVAIIFQMDLESPTEPFYHQLLQVIHIILLQSNLSMSKLLIRQGFWRPA